MRIRFFTDLILEMFLVPLSSSRIFWIISCLVLLLLSLMYFLIFLLISRIRSFSCFAVVFLSCMRARISLSFLLLLALPMLQLLLLFPQCSLWCLRHLPLPSMLPCLLLLLLLLFVVIFLILFGSASLTSCSRSLYINSCSSSHVSLSISVGCVLLRRRVFLALGISNFAMTHLWSLPMSIVSLASASLLQQ